MKTGLFLVSALGFFSGIYFLWTGLEANGPGNDLIYTILLIVLLCNSLTGIVMTAPDVFAARHRLRLPAKYDTARLPAKRLV